MVGCDGEKKMTKAQSAWVDNIIEYYWDAEDETILIIEYHEYFTWEQYYELMAGVYEYIEGRVDAIAYINIWHKGLALPQGLALPHLQNMLARFNDPIIVSVDLGKISAYAHFLRILARILKRPVDRNALDVPSARQMIYQIRENVVT